MDGAPAPLVELRDICVTFGGVRAVDHASIELYAGEVLALVGHNGAGKSTLAKVLSGACARASGTIRIAGAPAAIDTPGDARGCGIETIYQSLALADNVDAAANVFLGRELTTAWGTLDDLAMEAQTRAVIGRLNGQFARFRDPVKALSGGQRQAVAIARAIVFNARVLIMDEPTAALGPHESAQVADLIGKLKADGIAILLISHDIHDVFHLADRICAMKNGRVVGTARVADVSREEVLGMIIAGQCPPAATPGPGAIQLPAERAQLAP